MTEHDERQLAIAYLRRYHATADPTREDRERLRRYFQRLNRRRHNRLAVLELAKRRTP
jgi:hypothetical protein